MHRNELLVTLRTCSFIEPCDLIFFFHENSLDDINYRTIDSDRISGDVLGFSVSRLLEWTILNYLHFGRKKMLVYFWLVSITPIFSLQCRKRSFSYFPIHIEQYNDLHLHIIIISAKRINFNEVSLILSFYLQSTRTRSVVWANASANWIWTIRVRWASMNSCQLRSYSRIRWSNVS